MSALSLSLRDKERFRDWEIERAWQHIFRDPERTATVLDNEGWLHTGDVGEWLPSGTLKIIDHKKLIFKLSRGEYVAPDKVEAIYKRSPYVAQVIKKEFWKLKRGVEG